MYLKTLTPERRVSESGYRFLNPEIGTWISRDPIEDGGRLSTADEHLTWAVLLRERGGPADSPRQPSTGTGGLLSVGLSDSYLVLYHYVSNEPLGNIDPHGLVEWTTPGTFVAANVAPWADEPSVKGVRTKGKTMPGGTLLDVWSPYLVYSQQYLYWCHGYTFDGAAPGGPYHSVWGSAVPTILQDEGWNPICCGLADPSADIAVFYDNNPVPVSHSGKIESVVLAGWASAATLQFDEVASQLRSKPGHEPLGTKSFHENATGGGTAQGYGRYTCYTQMTFALQPIRPGCCPRPGTHEIPWTPGY